MNQIILYFVYALIAIVVLTAATNMIVALTKKIVAWDKFPTQVWVLAVSFILSYLTLFIASSIVGIKILWYYYIGTAFIALCVCYAAIFGYDNLYSYIWQTVKQIKQVIADFITEKKE